MLNDIQINAIQQVLSKRCGVGFFEGFINTTRFNEPNFQINPDLTNNNSVIQVAFVENHWVTITNFYPFHPVIDSSQWFMFDSLNDAKYIQYLKPVFKSLNHEYTQVKVVSYELP